MAFAIENVIYLSHMQRCIRQDIDIQQVISIVSFRIISAVSIVIGALSGNAMEVFAVIVLTKIYQE